MQIITCIANDRNISDALGKLVAKIKKQQTEQPDFILLASTYDSVGDRIREALLDAFPGCPFMGVSSEGGIITNDPAYFNSKECISAMCFYDPQGDYCVGSGIFEGDGTQVLQKSILNSLTISGRKGELPDLSFFLFSQLYRQQSAISVFENLFGRSVPIFGGGSGFSAGHQECYTNLGSYLDEDFFAFCLAYPSCVIKSKVKNFYHDLPCYGIITKVSGNRIQEIDNQPALEVYIQWLNDNYPKEMIKERKDIINDLFNTHPLGVQMGLSSSENNFLNYVITGCDDTGSLHTATPMRLGTRVHLMETSDHDQLLPGLVDAIQAGSVRKDCSEIYGLINVTCMVLHDELIRDDVSFLKDVPFPVIGFFSRGEHGQLVRGINSDSNLMLESIILCQEN